MLSVRLPQELEERLQKLSEKKRRTRSYLVKEALERFLNREEPVAEALDIYESHLRSKSK